MLTSSAGRGEDTWKFSTDLLDGFDMELEKTAGSREHLDLSLSY